MMSRRTNADKWLFFYTSKQTNGLAKNIFTHYGLTIFIYHDIPIAYVHTEKGKNMNQNTTIKNKSERLRSIRLSIHADEALHREAHRRGDVKRRILEAVQAVDMQALDCAHFRRPKQRNVTPKQHQYVTTTITMDDGLYNRLRTSARQKDVSVAVLVDYAILTHFDADASVPLAGAHHD